MRSLRVRLTFWFSLAVTITAGTVAWIGYLRLHKQMLAGIDFLLDAEAQEVEARLASAARPLTTDHTDEELAEHSAIDAPQYYFQVHRIGHGIVFRSSNLGHLTLPEIERGAVRSRDFLLDGEPARQFERTYRDYRIQVATSLEQLEALLARYRHSMLLVFPTLFGVSVAIGWVMATVALRPIRAMQKSARRISATNLSERLPVPPGRDEIADLARLLNDLFARLEASFEQVRQFTADASHELKTPLSLVRLHAERLLKSRSLDDDAREDVESQLEEIARLNKLVENLLLLARADAGGLYLDRKLISTAAFISDFAEDATALAEDRGIQFLVTQNADIQVSFDPIMFRQVLLNLHANAVRHTPPGRSITLASRQTGDNWELDLADEGPGIEASALMKVFGRFVRAPSPDGQKSDGSGLGLAIARSIVEAHGGTLAAENRPTGGLLVRVSLAGVATPTVGA